MTGLTWRNVDISKKLFTNVEALTLPAGFSKLENSYINEAGGHSRFPVLKAFTTLAGGGTVFPYEWRGQLVCVTTTGKVFVLDQSGNARDVTGVPVAGGRRVIFAETEDRLCMVAGAEIIQFDGNETSILSKDAPRATHIAFIGGFLVANEVNSGLFFHNATAGDFDTWTPLDVFAADQDPDNIGALISNDFDELIIGGEHSIEQHERGINTVFSFRFRISGSVYAPYTLVFTNNAAWALSGPREFIRISGQSTVPFSEDIAKTLESVDDWTEAWAAPVAIDGQNFIVLQAPFATGPDGNKGVTYLLDVRGQTPRWSVLYINDDKGLRTRWPGWAYCYHDRWNRRFVGGESGQLFEMVSDISQTAHTQKMVGRSAPYREGFVTVENVRLWVKRGVGAADTNPQIRFRAIRDDKTPTRWVTKGLGTPGDQAPYIEFGGMGTAGTFEFEWEILDNVPVDISRLQVQAQRAD